MHYGLIGQNISYSLSPKIHETAATILEVACRYNLFELEKIELADFLARFYREGGQGLNVTSPHKEDVIHLLERAPSEDAVNLLLRGNKGWVGVNSDGPGFYQALVARGISDFSDLVFLGNGGVVTSILNHLKSQLRKVVILRRQSTRDATFTERFPMAKELSFYPLQPDVLQAVLKNASCNTILIHACSGSRDSAFWHDFSSCLKNFPGYFIDLSYRQENPLLAKAASFGIRHEDGLMMLAQQAQIAQELWWGKSLPAQELLNLMKQST